VHARTALPSLDGCGARKFKTMRRCVAAAVIARQKNRCRRQRPPAARKLPRRVARVYAQRKEAWYVRVRRRWAPQEQGRVRDGGLKDFAEPRFVRGLRFVPLLVSGRRERYAKDHCANGSCGAPRERGGLPSGCPGPSACGIAVPLAGAPLAPAGRHRCSGDSSPRHGSRRSRSRSDRAAPRGGRCHHQC
jgi:hypothetical protein